MKKFAQKNCRKMFLEAIIQKLRCVICTGVTIFALVLHLNCTALGQSESSNFSCVLLKKVIACFVLETFTFQLTLEARLCSVSLVLRFLPGSRTDVGSLAVGVFDLVNCFLSVVGFVPVFNVGQ